MNVKGKLKDHIGVAESVLCSERLCDISLDCSIYVGALLFYLLFGQLGGAVVILQISK